MALRPVSFRWDEAFVARLDAARKTSAGTVSRSEFVRRAVERALSEAKGPSVREQADPGPVLSSEGVRSAAPAEQPLADRVIAESLDDGAGAYVSPRSRSGAHAPNCKCPVCS